MLDRDVVLLEGQRNGAVWYLDGRKRDEAQRDGVVAVNPQPLLPAGAAALYTAREARKYNLCQQLKDTRQEVAELYQLTPSSLREDPLQGRTPEVWRIEFQGEVNKAFEERMRRRLDRATRRGANLLILHLEVGGGSFEVARDLADFIRRLPGPDR